MNNIEPTPNSVEVSSEGTTSSIWRTWFNNIRQYAISTYAALIVHTGGGTPTSPATGTSWNAHGNTATGNALGTDSFKIENGSLWLSSGSGAAGANGTGDYPAGAEYQGGASEYKLLWYGKKGAFRAGLVGTDRWDEANIGPQSFAVGANSKASGQDAIALGSGNDVSGIYSLGVGLGNDCSVLFSAAIGYNNEVIGNFGTAFAFGSYCKVTGFNAFIIGSGAGPSTSRFVNSKNNSVAIGANINSSTDLATLLLQNGRCGINNETPLSTLDVGGSVGYKQDNLAAVAAGAIVDVTYGGPGVITFANSGSDGTMTIVGGDLVNDGFTVGSEVVIDFIAGNGTNDESYLIKAVAAGVLTVAGNWPVTGTATSDYRLYQSPNQKLLTDELVVDVDLSLAPNTRPAIASAYTVILPPISTVPRRMYHVCIVSPTVSADVIHVWADKDAGDQILDSENGNAPVDYVEYDAGVALQIVANETLNRWIII